MLKSFRDAARGEKPSNLCATPLIVGTSSGWSTGGAMSADGAKTGTERFVPTIYGRCLAGAIRLKPLAAGEEGRP